MRAGCGSGSYNVLMWKKSPFPGMDPYLERHSGDFHHSLIQYGRDQLQEKLPEPLRARVQERVYVEADEGWSGSFFPDIRIVERRDREATGVEERIGGTAVAEPGEDAKWADELLRAAGVR
jgi:hypothetical protein